MSSWVSQNSLKSRSITLTRRVGYTRMKIITRFIVGRLKHTWLQKFVKIMGRSTGLVVGAIKDAIRDNIAESANLLTFAPLTLLIFRDT